MRNRRLITLAVALAARMAWSTGAEAQKFQPFGPLEFNDEFRPFAPAEVGSFVGGPKPHTGSFFTYDLINGM
ncbi:MAG: hypothetical protein OES79_00985 [Planctomycetota bacterium]|nr:hypothetical protein [Planctomycetota bacterium]